MRMAFGRWSPRVDKRVGLMSRSTSCRRRNWTASCGGERVQRGISHARVSEVAGRC